MSSLRTLLRTAALRAASLLLAVLALVAVQVSCGGGGGGGGSTGGGGGKTLSSIILTPSSPKLAAGTSLQLKATGIFSDGSTQDLTAAATWTSSATSVATVSSSGLAAGLVAGTTTVKATSGSINGTATLTVTNATLASLVITPANPVVAKGATQQFTATGTFSDASTQDLTTQVTWSSSSAGIATVNPLGLATGAGAGSATITATRGAVSASTGILVTPGTGVTLTGLAVTPANPKLAKGFSLQFAATGTFSDASTADVSKAVTWSSSSVATATISASGLATGVAAGSATIGAANGSVSGSTTLTVTNATLSSILVSPANLVLPKGATQAYTATGTFSDGSSQNLSAQVAWSSSSAATATISATGTATALAAGSTTITATKGAVSGSTKLTVTGTAGVSLVSLAVTPANAKIAASTSLQYKATGTFSDASTADLTAAVAWSSSASGVASIDATGLASGLAAGSATITASAGSISGSTGLTVSNATLTSIAVTPINPVIPVAGTQAFTATGTFSDGSSQNLSSQVTWASSSIATATIGASGLATGVAAGSTTISATKGAVSGATLLTVTAKPGVTLTALAVAPVNPTIAAATSLQFTATGTFSDGSRMDLTAAVAWTSSSAATATIDASGLATGVAAGTTTIKAVAGSASVATTLTVTNATLVSIAVTPANAKIAKGTGLQFKATGTFSDASTQDLTTQVTWASSTTGVATIGSTGFASGVAAGATTISAAKGAVNGSTGLTVTNATLVSIAVTPANASVAKGATRQFTATGTFSDASTQYLTTQVAWTSSNASIATIGASTGLATGVATGTVIVKATFGAVSGSTFLTVVPAAPVTLTSITVAPPTASIAKGTTQAFVATGHYSDGSSLNLSYTATWASTDTAVATVTATGLAKGTGVGGATISATVGAVSGNATLTVTAATLSSIAIVPLNPSAAAGTGVKFTATGTFSDGTKQDISATAAWSSSNGAAATVDTTGFASALAVGTTTITATSGAFNASTTLTVTNATLVSIAVTPANAKLAAGYTRQFAATGTFSDASTQDLTTQVTWASSDTLAASIDAAGLATGLAPGTPTITATFGAVSGGTTLTITNATLVALAVTPANTSVVKGSTRQFTATGTFSDASTLPMTTQVTWSSSNAAVATIGASTGLATGLATGTTTITATSGSVSGSTFLTVFPSGVSLSAISITPASATLAKGQAQAFTATGVFSDGSKLNLTNAVTWASSDKAVATVTTSGVAKGVGVGGATITATYGIVAGSASLTVNPAALVSIALLPSNPTAAAGTSVQFTATGTYTDGTKADLSASAAWSSSNTAAASISSTGLASALTAGTTTIMATSGSVSASTTLTVTGATLLSIAVTPVNAKVAAGTGRQYAATGAFSDGSTQNLTTQVTWASSNTAAATITGSGFASGLAAGTTTISATLGAVNGSTTLTVTNATLVSLAVTPANATLVKGATRQYAATGTFSDGTTQPMTTQATWASSAPSIASISSGGLATGLGVGTTTISATFGSITGGTYLTVMPSGVALSAISVSPASASIPKGTTKSFTATGVYSDGSSQNLSFATTWTSSDTTVASVTSIGLAKGLAVGSSTIRAALGAISGAGSLTVTPAVLSSLAVTPANPTIAAGTSLQFTATGTFSDGTKQDVTSAVTWASSTGAATIDTAGLATGASAGASSISATSGAINASTTLTVTNATLVSIAVTPINRSIAATTGLQYKATGTFSDASAQDLTTQVTWNSSVTGVATIDASGFASGVAPGTTTISATSGAISGGTSLTVTSATLVSIAVTPANGTLQQGRTKQFTATGTFSDASTQDLTTQVQWASSNGAVAGIDTKGLATGLATGTTSISATFGAVTGSTSLTVVPPSGVTLTSIVVTPANPSAIAGATVQFTATGHYSDGSTVDLSLASTWTSSNGAAATISGTGLATTTAAGSTTIKAALGAVNGSTTLTVAGVALTSITVTPTAPTIAKLTQQQFTATGHYNDGSTADLTATATWSSSNTAAATIVAGGLATGVNAGTTTIQATSGAISGSTTLTVTAATLTSLAVTPINAVIPAGSSQQFTATGTFSDASTQDLSSQATWSSTNMAVATIGSTGLATGVVKGSTTITATFNAVSASTGLTVSATSAALTAVVVTPPAPKIALGTTQQFTATGVFSDGTTQPLAAVAWVSSATSVATINGAGLASGLTAGTSTISATANGITGNATLTVTSATLVSIQVTPAGAKIAAGTSLQYTATGHFSDGTVQNLTSLVAWASSATGSATISTGGLATGVSAGGTTITATFGAVVGSTTLTVSSATLSSISVSPMDPSIAAGTTQAFQAEGLFSDGSKQDLTTQVAWSSSATAVATIDAAGLATSSTTGTTTITATFGAVNGSTTLTVTPATLVSIAVTPTDPSAPAGINVQLTATGTFTDGTNQDLTSLASWTSADTAVAVVDPAGSVVGLVTGSSAITAKVGSVSGSTTFTVTNATLTSITLDPPAPFLALGAQQQMTATGVFSDGTSLDLTSQAVWTSSTPTVAVVDPAGLVTTPSGSVTGTTTVTATLSGVSGSTVVTVTAATLTSISVFGNTPLGVGTTDPYTATGIYSDGSTADLTALAVWSSSDTAVATVDNVPLTSGLVSAVGAGTATITATSGGISGSATVTVTAATLTSITVTPANQTIAATTTLQYTATGNFSDGSIQDLTLVATWSSSNPAAADISSAAGTEGLATGIGAGSTTISATFGGVVGSTNLTVTTATLVSIAVTPANSSLPRGFSQQMVATGTFSDGSTQDLSTQATWTSSNATVAVISNASGTQGTVTALVAGTTTLTATLNGVSGSTGLTVTNVVLVSIAVTPANKTISVGRRQKMVATGTFSDGSTKVITNQVTWTSSDPTIARINAGKKGGAGKVLGISPGTVTITATKPPSGGQPAVIGSTSLTVK